jgi:hypothetical protein
MWNPVAYYFDNLVYEELHKALKLDHRPRTKYIHIYISLYNKTKYVVSRKNCLKNYKREAHSRSEDFIRTAVTGTDNKSYKLIYLSASSSGESVENLSNKMESSKGD